MPRASKIEARRNNDDSIGVVELTTLVNESISEWFTIKCGDDWLFRLFGNLDIERSDDPEEPHYSVTLDDSFRVSPNVDNAFNISMSLTLGLYHDGDYSKLAVHDYKGFHAEVYIDDGKDDIIAEGILRNPAQIEQFLHFMTTSETGTKAETFAAMFNLLQPIAPDLWMRHCLGDVEAVVE